MTRLEFELEGKVITVDGVEGERLAGLITEAMVGVFERLTKGIVRDNEERFQTPAIQNLILQLAGSNARLRDVYPIPSRSKPWTYHAVRHYGYKKDTLDPILICPCKGFEHRGYCSHIPMALDKFKRKRQH